MTTGAIQQQDKFNEQANYLERIAKGEAYRISDRTIEQQAILLFFYYSDDDFDPRIRELLKIACCAIASKKGHFLHKQFVKNFIEIPNCRDLEKSYVERSGNVMQFAACPQVIWNGWMEFIVKPARAAYEDMRLEKYNAKKFKRKPYIKASDPHRNTQSQIKKKELL